MKKTSSIINYSQVKGRNYLLLYILFFLLVITGCKSDRFFFRAKFEPKTQVLVGAGQVDPADFLAFSKATDNTIKPLIFMDYLDANDQNLNKFFDSLEAKQKSIPWKTYPQLGLGFDDSKGKTYDSLVEARFYDDHLKLMAKRIKQLNCPVFLRIHFCKTKRETKK
jgi:hypothetical protein